MAASLCGQHQSVRKHLNDSPSKVSPFEVRKCLSPQPILRQDTELRCHDKNAKLQYPVGWGTDQPDLSQNYLIGKRRNVPRNAQQSFDMKQSQYFL